MIGVWTDSGRIDSGLTQLGLKRPSSVALVRMVTSIDRDGSGSGLELRLISLLSENLIVPVIASGGCGLAQHFVEGYAAGASAVAAGTFFHNVIKIQCNAGLISVMLVSLYASRFNHA